MSNKKLPRFKTDAEAENFVATADLSKYDLTQGVPLSAFEFQPKDASVYMKLPSAQLEAIKSEAKKRGIPYQRFIRHLLERAMNTLGA